ncbi:hypothetical protein [Streptomyces sp. NPDC001380]|uniref:hypothetical protein n=1 Tax=Streptomyces sp. NPDC001380 TaxID=3364566 RepID=UPI0036C6F32E
MWPLQAAEPPVPDGTVLSEQRQTTVEIGDLTEGVALRLAVRGKGGDPARLRKQAPS